MKGVVICLLGLVILTGCSNDTSQPKGRTLEQNLTTYLEQQDYISEDDISVFRIYDIGKSYEYYLVEYSTGQYMIRLPSDKDTLTEDDVTVTAWETVVETPYEREQTQNAIRYRQRSRSNSYTPIIIP